MLYEVIRGFGLHISPCLDEFRSVNHVLVLGQNADIGSGYLRDLDKD